MTPIPNDLLGRRFFTLGLLLTALAIPAAAQPALTFTFANGQITGGGTTYEIDIMITAGAPGTELGDTQVFLNYNQLAFGTNVQANGTITVTKGLLVAGNPFYDNTAAPIVINDTNPSRVAITMPFAGIPGFGQALPTTPEALLHLVLTIADPGQSSGLFFEEAAMAGQQFHADNTTTYTPVIAFDVDTASLPVELISFEALLDGNTVVLHWKTASETNNAGFEIQRRPAQTGAMPTLPEAWHVLDFIEGHGTTLALQHYHFKDEALALGSQRLSYRLKQIDFDGTFAYSPIVEVTLSPPKRVVLHGNFPNPFNPQTFIHYTLPITQRVHLAVYDAWGRERAVLVNGPQQAGRHATMYDASTLPSGVYFYRLHTPSSTYTRTMLLAK